MFLDFRAGREVEFEQVLELSRLGVEAILAATEPFDDNIVLVHKPLVCVVRIGELPAAFGLDVLEQFAEAASFSASHSVGWNWPAMMAISPDSGTRQKG
jgi:hypothetical protein